MTTQPQTMPSHEAIATQAYLLWEQEGRKPGMDREYWTRAEAQLLGETQNRSKARARSPRKNAAPAPSTARRTARASAKSASPKPAVASRRKSPTQNTKSTGRKRTS